MKRYIVVLLALVFSISIAGFSGVEAKGLNPKQMMGIAKIGMKFGKPMMKGFGKKGIGFGNVMRRGGGSGPFPFLRK